MKILLITVAMLTGMTCMAQETKTTLIPKVAIDTTSLDFKMKKFIKNQETEIKQAKKEKGKKQPIKKEDQDKTANREAAEDYLKKNR